MLPGIIVLVLTQDSADAAFKRRRYRRAIEIYTKLLEVEPHSC